MEGRWHPARSRILSLEFNAVFYAGEVQRLLYQSEAELLRLRELQRIMQLSGLPNLLLSLRGLNLFQA